MTKKPRNPSEPVFKEYDQEQSWLFPPNLNDMVPKNHVVRVVDHIIEQLDLERLYGRYKGGGRSSYHPKMMLKLVIYAYTQRIYSSRQIAKAARENIYFRWIAGSNTPDFRTINRFRSVRLRSIIDELFYSVVDMLEQLDLIDLKDYFLDGTKIEANANRYTFVWKKSNQKYKASLEKKVKALLIEIDEASKEEDEKYGDKDLEEMGEALDISSEDIEKLAEKINKKLKNEPDNKELKRNAKKVNKDFLPRMKKYEKQEKILDGRNSYSKTDTDATFMRMKDDHMKNGQLKPAYNVQIGTENQFITGYSIHQKAGDTSCLINHIEGLEKNLKKLPDNIIADAGYGSEENYSFFDKNGLNAYVKFNNFHYEQKRKFKKNPFRKENFPYDKKTDSYACPGGQRLKFSETKIEKSTTGYEYTTNYYECENCDGCTLREQCHRSQYNRRITAVSYTHLTLPTN